MTTMLKTAIEKRLHEAILGECIIGNTLRGLFVEAMLAEILAPEWKWVGANWSSWDFEHHERWDAVEVKQAAALQPWSDQYTRLSPPRFDIAERSGYWYQDEGSLKTRWHREVGRPADLYVFAWHGVVDKSVADQRDPDQWTFYISRASDLPRQRSIGLSGIQKCRGPYGIADVKIRLEKLAEARPSLRKLTRETRANASQVRPEP